MTRNFIAALAVALPLAGPALAAPVDLSGFTPAGRGATIPENWVFGDGGFVVISGPFQNTLDPAFFGGAENVQGKSLEASVRVRPPSPQTLNRVGFAIGISPGEGFDDLVPVDYWLIDWQGSDQSFFGAPVLAGLALSHVTGRDAGTQIWTHNRTGENSFQSGPGFVVEEVARGMTLGRTGWTPDTAYDFRFNFTSSLIEVFVDNVLEISHAGSFTDGSFAFLTAGQPGAIFMLNSNAFGTTAPSVPVVPQDPVPPTTPSVIPLPAPAFLLLAGIGGLGLLRRRP
jgi:hypothetical protein